MRLGFVTCVQLGLSCMEEIYSQGENLSLVITLKDNVARKKSGRVYLDEFCQKKNLSLLKIRNINDPDVIDAIEVANLDWLFIIGWSQIAKDAVLRAPSKGVIGIHPTLLPEGRGRAPIPWAIIKNLKKTGVTLFKLDSGVDTGPIITQIELPLTNKTTSTSLYSDVNKAHVVAIREGLKKIKHSDFQLTQQDNSKSTYWEARSPKDGAIDLEGSVYDAERLVRAASSPYPGAYIEQKSKKIVVWKAAIRSTELDCISDVNISFKDGYLDCLNIEYSIS